MEDTFDRIDLLLEKRRAEFEAAHRPQQSDPQPQPQTPPETQQQQLQQEQDGEEFQVERIISSRVDEQGKEYFQVKWLGFPHSDNTWEPEEHLVGCQLLLNQFIASRVKR